MNLKGILFSLGLFGFCLYISSCDDTPIPHKGEPRLGADSAFAAYWYAGDAEITSFKLEQARYGEVRTGSAVLIFVTEPFSLAKQVKLDNPQSAQSDEQTVLKLNFTKNFITGIYPYSMMLSAFTPVETQQYPHSPKVAMSSQEWCGQVFSQINLEPNSYKVNSFSYFEREGDAQIILEKALLEDEIWNRIRLNYKALPTGDISIIPGFFHTRLLHEDQKVEQAEASLEELDQQAKYTIDFSSNGRKLSIWFSTVHPYPILGWDESVIGRDGKVQTTKAVIDRTLKIDYWKRNGNEYQYLRDSLNLGQMF